MTAKIPECHPNRKYLAKGMCNACYQKDRLDRSPSKRQKALESARLAKQKQRLLHPEGRFAQELKYKYGKYGLTLELWEALVARYNGACWICRQVPSTYLCVDHCHTTNTIRGVLCTSCNAGLGQFRDSLECLQRAIDYLVVTKVQ